MALSNGGSGQCPLSKEGLGTGRHVTEIVYHNEYLDNCLVGVEEGLKTKVPHIVSTYRAHLCMYKYVCMHQHIHEH